MDRRLFEYLRQIKISAQNSIDFVGDMTYAEFQADMKTQHAVSMSLINIGEAANRLSERFPDFVAAHSYVPWAEIRGMRNRIAHDYFFLNFQTVWETVCNELPQLLAHLGTIAKEQP